MIPSLLATERDGCASELSEDKLRALLPPVWKHNLYVLPSVPSTNLLALDRSAQGYPEGTLVIAEQQTAGRGRLGRSWYSPAGVNLYLSILLQPTVPLDRIALLTFVAAIAAHKAFKTHGLHTGIKWPNDLGLGTPFRKIAGILAEMRTDRRQNPTVVVGAGFNLNVPESLWSSDMQYKATSYLIETHQTIDRESFAATFLHALYDTYQVFCQERWKELCDSWRDASITLGREVTIQTGTRILSGKALDIDEQGALWVNTENGIQKVTAGDVSMVG